jgi:hypothetical protein
VSELLKGPANTQYTVTSGENHTKIIITQDTNFHTYFSVRNPENIFLSNYGSLSVQNIGQGINPQLHLSDMWISYFNPTDRTIVFEHTTNAALKFSIRINARINPYFVPEVLMADETTVYYTDLGENGIPGIVEYKRNLNKGELIFKATTPMVKFELCFSNSKLYFLQAGINSSSFGTLISQIIFPFKDFKNREVFYSSTSDDLGHMICNFSNDALYFIKNTGPTGLPSYDIAEYVFSTKKLSLLSDQKNATSIINMDGTLLTLDHSTYYIVKGKSDFKNIDILKSKDAKETKENKDQQDESDDE